MKRLITIILILAAAQAFAVNRYFDATLGNDSNTGTQASPYKTITKLNTLFASMSNGDSVLFKRGETFYGEIVCNHSYIKFGAYGTGAKPIISGWYTVPAWTNVSGNIWESTAAVSTLSTCNIISINGAQYSQGRTPNTDYWTIQSTNGTSTIVDAVSGHLNTTNWTGAQVVMRKYRWIMDKYTISSASGSTINFTSGGDAVQAGYGYFIINDQRCLDQANEWSYNTSTKKISIYSVGSPTAVIKVPALATAINLNGEDNCSFSNLDIQGFNSTGINTTSQNDISILDCDIRLIGQDAIYAYPNSNTVTVTRCTITDIGSRGIHTGASSSAYVSSNACLRIGQFAGMGGNGDDSYTGIIALGDNAQVIGNSVTSVGYCGIRWDGNSTRIENNFVDTHNRIKDDGGGIYSYPSAYGPIDQNFTQRTVKNNIIINGIGAAAGGAPSSNFPEAFGIYADGTSPNIDFINNTISGAHYGLFLNGSHQVLLRGNTIYDCKRGLFLLNYNPSIGIADITIRGNLFIAKDADQYAAYYEPAAGAMPASFDADSNVYARPIDDNQTIWIDSLGNNRYKTLAQWKATAFASGEDAASTKSPVSVNSTAQLRIDYNNTASSVPVYLPSVYKDMLDKVYPGVATVSAYSSLVLAEYAVLPGETPMILNFQIVND